MKSRSLLALIDILNFYSVMFYLNMQKVGGTSESLRVLLAGKSSLH